MTGKQTRTFEVAWSAYAERKLAEYVRDRLFRRSPERREELRRRAEHLAASQGRPRVYDHHVEATGAAIRDQVTTAAWRAARAA